MDATQLILDVACLTMKPGDVLVVRPQKALNHEQMRHFSAWLKSRPELAHIAERILVMHPDVDLTVVTPEKEA
jgi:hypothetical protein